MPSLPEQLVLAGAELSPAEDASSELALELGAASLVALLAAPAAPAGLIAADLIACEVLELQPPVTSATHPSPSNAIAKFFIAPSPPKNGHRWLDAPTEPTRRQSRQSV
jgi:hypothetical protein